MSEGTSTKLENINKVLRYNSIFFAVGMLLLLISGMGLKYAMEFTNKLPDTLCGIAWGIIGLPKIIAVLFGGIGNALFGPLKADYEVVTVDRFGNTVSSDGGAESMNINLIGRIIQLVILYLLGALVTIIHLIILSIRYVITSITTKAKSSVIPNGFIIIIINIAVLVGGFTIGAVIQKTAEAVKKAAYNAEYGVKTVGDFETELNEQQDGRIIKRYKGKGGSVVIPDTIDGLPVVSIHWPAFQHNKEVKQVTLPKTLQFIQVGAFEGSGITSIVIPEGVTDIGQAAFASCKDLTSVTLPSSVKRIGGSFKDCTSLTDVRIPEGKTIKYGNYWTGGRDNAIFIPGMYTNAYFEEDSEYGESGWPHKESFKGCTKLSSDSRQAIKDSGYIGEF
jgi:hypothetical protein